MKLNFQDVNFSKNGIANIMSNEKSQKRGLLKVKVKKIPQGPPDRRSPLKLFILKIDYDLCYLRAQVYYGFSKGPTRFWKDYI